MRKDVSDHVWVKAQTQMFVHMDQILRVTHNHQHNNRRRGTKRRAWGYRRQRPPYEGHRRRGVTGHIDSVHTEGRFHRNL